MKKPGFDETLALLLKEDPRYPRDAYLFLRHALNFTVKDLKKPDQGPARHITGQELLEGIRRYLHADSLAYLSQEGMVKATGLPADGFCMACYDGRYPVPYEPALDKEIIERRRRRIETLGESLAKEEMQINLL